MSCPIDYSLCDRTVTVYRFDRGKLWREVIEGCYYVHELVERTDVLGRRWERRFLLIMPGSCQRIWVGDRVYDGVGPEIADIDWDTFTPVRVDGLGEVAYVRSSWWGGEVCHMEAGRK